jgi:hypothetical protein
MFKRPWADAGAIIAKDPATNNPVTNASITFFMVASLKMKVTQVNGRSRAFYPESLARRAPTAFVGPPLEKINQEL